MQGRVDQVLPSLSFCLFTKSLSSLSLQTRLHGRSSNRRYGCEQTNTEYSDTPDYSQHVLQTQNGK